MAKLSTVDEIRNWLGSSATVEVGELTLRLKPPTAAAAVAVREQLFNSVGNGDGKSGTVLKAAALAAGACLDKKLTEEELSQLILRSGGERGPLAKKAFELCGLDEILNQDQVLQQESDPVPFS